MAVRWLLPLLLAFSAEAQVLRVSTAQIPATTASFDVTWPGVGFPSGAIVFGGYATAQDTLAADAGMSCGMTDFTGVVAVHHANSEDNVADSDSHSEHNESNVFLVTTPGTGADIRTLSAASINNGVRFTPGESGTQYQIMVLGVFADDFAVFSGGSGTAQDATYAFAHGLAGAPEAGIYCYSPNNQEADANARLGLGFHEGTSSLTQRGFAVNVRNSQADGLQNAQLRDDRVAFSVNPGAGTEAAGWEITANDATNTTFTARTASPGGDLIGGLFYLPTADAYVGTVTSPNATGAWNNSDLSFQPGAILGLVTQAETINTALSDDARAGTFGVFASDFIDEYGAAFMDENAAATINSASYLASELWLGDDDQTEDYACNGFAADNDGWTATCDTADATANLWPFLAISGSSGVAVLKNIRDRSRL